MSDKEIQDSLGLSIPSYRFLTPGTGFPILVSGTWIPDSNRYRDSGFLELYSRYYRKPGFQIYKKAFLDSRFHRQKFPGLRSSDFFTWGERNFQRIVTIGS